MPSESQRAERFRGTPMLGAAGVLLIAAVVLLLVNVSAQRTHVIWGWVPVLLATAVAGLACWQAAAADGLDRVARRLWRQLAVVCALVACGNVGDVRATVLYPEVVTQQEHDPVTSMIYVLAVLVLLWALLRLPVGIGRQREHMVRFFLDAATVTVTVGIFGWYYTYRQVATWDTMPGNVVPMIMLASMGLIGALAFVKVAISGLGALDPPAIRLLAAAAGVGATGGGFFPLLVDLHPGVSGSQVFVPATMLFVVLAADRQRRAAALPHENRPRRLFSIVPYAAVAATDGLLIMVAHGAGTAVTVTALAGVLLTALVVVRQLSSLRENGLLLRRVDASLVELSGYQAQLTHRATHDDLTDLANRSLFEQESQAALRSIGEGRSLGLALIDLDDFKAINDRLGHAVGDALLIVIAGRLRDCVRSDDVVARLGGDEFGLLLHGLRGDEAADVLDRIADVLTRPVRAKGYDLLVKASIGLAEAWPGAGAEELLRRADLAMYAAKARGKGRYAVYDAELEQHQAADAQLGAELRRALDRGEFFLVYQPIVQLPGGEWTGVETLVRWQHPQRGLVPPDVFIPIAERTGLIVPLGDWILRTACGQAAEWLAGYGAGAPGEVGVNVSARQLSEPGFAADVAEALADAGLAPGRLVVEVTETAVFDGGVALDTLRAIAELGAGVALDDFGTGHSSLGLLRTCPADTLKVDKSFVDGIGGTTEEAVIATALIQITNGLHLQAIAEGVETAEQAETLHRLGYRFAQGYHFSRPLTAQQVREHLDADRAGKPSLAK